MPVINITTWPTPLDVKKNMMEEITRVVHETSGAPLDKITVYIHEIQQENWADAGVIGNDLAFREKSRRLNYDD